MNFRKEALFVLYYSNFSFIFNIKKEIFIFYCNCLLRVLKFYTEKFQEDFSVMNILSADIGGTATKFAYWKDGLCIGQKELSLDGKQGAGSLLESLFAQIEQFPHFDCIGISTAGQVDPGSGTIIYANENIPGYTGTPLRRLLEDRFHVPAAVENDVCCAAIGEAFYGAGKGVADFLCMTVGTGIGGAVFSGGRLITGCGYRAGEFGHLITHPGGLSCTCGGKGCYEQYASTSALVRAVTRIMPELTDGRKIFAAQKNAHPKLQEIISHWLDEIVLGLVSLTHLFDPERIILGGGVMSVPWLAPEIESRLRTAVIPSYRGVRVVPAELGNSAGLFGAAELARKIMK